MTLNDLKSDPIQTFKVTKSRRMYDFLTYCDTVHYTFFF